MSSMTTTLKLLKFLVEIDGMIDYNEDRKELQTERMIDDFIAECEREAAKLEITVDYYIAEFIEFHLK